MKKLMVLLVAVAVALSAVYAVKLEDVLNKDMMTKGYSAKLTMTTDGNLLMSGMVYQKDEKSRSEIKMGNMPGMEIMAQFGLDEMITIIKDKKLYTLYPKKKKYTETDMGGTDPTMMNNANEDPSKFDYDQNVEKVGTEKIGSITADKYKMIPNKDEKLDGEMFFFIDPATKMIIGVHVIGNDGTVMKVEYTNITIGVNESVFSIPAGYTKTTQEGLMQ